MRKTVVCSALVLLCVALAAAASEKVKTVQESYPAASVKTLSIEVPVGEIRAEAWDGSEVQVVMEISCDHGDSCKETAEKIKLDSTVSGEKLVLEVKGYPKHSSGGLSVDLTVKVPKQLAFKGEIGVGDVELRGLQHDVTLKIGVGDARLRGPASSVRSVDLEVGVGDADLSVPGENPKGDGFIGKEITWSAGKGTSEVDIEVGVGKAKVTLE